ncbi:unnamed protein product [Eruca vesicaria subsp. sativa]|uniref:Uncharacterized protein n=1 Tax=Eruca vesicaria subsp. sativa TaxID=29727 RepID=A0ABC8L209_ERUVS|nr:unnamed protein product [Eruca vesicaria subsp. sativa]
MPKIYAIDQAVPVTPGMQIVDVTPPATPENYSEVAAAVSTFCEFLAPVEYFNEISSKITTCIRFLSSLSSTFW